MEYLMTYGWAILIIAIVLVAFFSLNLFNPYTFSPKASPGSCQILRPNGPGSNLFVSAVGPTCTTNEIPQYVAKFNGYSTLMGTSSTAFVVSQSSVSITGWVYVAGFTGSNGGSGWWTNPNSLANMGLQVYPNIFPNPTSGAGFWFWLKNQSGNTSVCAINLPVRYNTWYFIAEVTNNTPTGTYNGILYVNGTPSCHFGFVNPGSEGLPTIGAYGTFYIWDGYLANIQYYNTTLSTSEIQALHAEGIGGTPVDIQNLVGWWPLNGNGNDYSGNGNNGVPTNVIFTSNWENGYSSP